MKTAKPIGSGATHSVDTPIANQPTAAILLAGGMSTRMGTDKASLLFEGRRLVEVMHDRLAALPGVSQVFVSGRIEGLETIPDEHAARGPLEGVRSVLGEVERRGLYFKQYLIAPVDMPLLSSDRLVQLLESSPREVDAVHFEDFELPMVLRNSQAVRLAIKELCGEATHARRRSFRQLLSAIAVRCLVLPEERLRAGFLNTNTPEEWERATI